MTKGERLLADAATLDARWNEAATDMVREEWELEAQAGHYGLQLADAVVLDRLAAQDLRDFVSWANGLDREAVEVSGGDIEALSGADYHEALARRIAHHSGRTALGLVGAKHDLQAHRVHYGRRKERLRAEDNVGLFRLEAKDLGL